MSKSLKYILILVISLSLIITPTKCADELEFTVNITLHNLDATLNNLQSQPKKYYLQTYTYVVFYKANWFQAAESCNIQGLQLATINSPEEMQTVDKLIKDGGSYLLDKWFWIGGTDLANEGSFSWFASGQPLTYSHFTQGQPDNAGNVEHCLHLWNIKGSFYFNDIGCNRNLLSICEDKI